MSYSFTISAPTAAGAKEALVREMAKVSMSQPLHAQDEAVVVASGSMFIDMLSPPEEGRLVSLSANGWLAKDGVNNTFIGGAMSITVGLVKAAI